MRASTWMPPRRRLEAALAWALVGPVALLAAWAWCSGRLGGAGPGLAGWLGFVAETVAVAWAPLGLLAVGLAAGAALRRLWAPAAVAAVVGLVALQPDIAAWTWSPRVVVAAEPGDVLRVATANLAGQNEDDPTMVPALRDLDADVLVLTEFSRSWAARLEPAFEDDYRYRWLAAAEDPPSDLPGVDWLRVAVWSRIPAGGNADVRILSGLNAQIRVPLRWGGRTFALYGIHPRKPYPYSLFEGAWSERNEILGWLRGERLPVVVAGDFNAPSCSAFLVRMRDLGLQSAGESVTGVAPATWPMDGRKWPPFRITLDYVMVGPALESVGFAAGPRTRSDHLAIVATLRWRR